ncbi:DUF3995 domain-containing protein [Ekhidna sp.]|uniref:DUF3995 domain-containing protein n=1 Tax=Ekhidna sp. TaxID=2608089 RepID=UPI003515108A
MILGALLFTIFLALSLLHLSWALGSAWGFENSLPTTEDGTRILNPKKIDCAVVGGGLLLFAIFYLIKADLISFALPEIVMKAASWVIPIIFLFRAVGDFKYVGFFKKVTSTSFAKRDSSFYSPLCLGIGVIAILTEFA